MSTWHVLAIERLGAPQQSWPSIFGPEAGADPVAANGLRTIDLTPHLAPLGELATQLDRDLVKGSTSNVQLDLADKDGALAASLGPGGSLATSTRYHGPWIEVWEHWGTTSKALRFRGYLDESSLQWTEEEALTQASVLHASQLLQERLISDFPALLRPWPSVPTNATQEFQQSTADALLHAEVAEYAPRIDGNAIEAGIWTVGQLSWMVGISRRVIWRTIEHPDYIGSTTWNTINYDPPAPSAASVVIAGTAYAVDHVAWEPDISFTVDTGDALNGQATTYKPVRIHLQGAPDLTGHLHLGDTVAWGIPESRRTHYLLNGSVIPPPAAGSDGARKIQLNTVEQLVPGDVLTLTFQDATSGTPRTVTADLPAIVDLDGEKGEVHLATALDQGYSYISKVRRNSQDPVLFDGLAYAKALVAPFTLDDSQFSPAPTDTPVFTWLPYDQAAPSLYGVHCLQTTAPGKLRAARRGPDNGSGAYPSAGVWSSAGGSWAWLGLPSASATHEVYADVLQFPGLGSSFGAPVIYIEGDLSAAASTPPNGWRHLWRSWKTPATPTQDPESTWDGSAVHWTPSTASGDIPAKLVAYVASTPTPGRYARTSAGVWAFQAHVGDASLGSSATPSISGSLPSGNWVALGMGILGSTGDDREVLQALVAPGSSYPWNSVSAVLMSQASGGNLAAVQSAQLWASGGATPAGVWALGGGLVVQTYSSTIEGISYPMTNLFRLDGAAVVSKSLRTLEVIPQTIQPLLRVQSGGAQKVPGWYALALETYADSNFAPSRRLRFLVLDADLNVVNGDLEADPAVPTSTEAYFSRGELVSSIMADGAIIARMVRTSRTTNDMVGVVGGRIFQVSNSLPVTVERLRIGATATARTMTIVGSGDGMTAADYLEKFAGAQLASLVPTAEGGFRLVSRAAGELHLRTFGSQRVSVLPAERGPQIRSEVWAGYIRKVRVSYTDPLAGSTATVEVQSAQQGGRVLELDHSDILASPTMARALGQAAAFWFGNPVACVQETWSDTTGGTATQQGPTWWAGWQVGDLVTFTSTPTSSPTPVAAWKIMLLQPGPEARSVRVELRAMPEPITPGAP